MDKKLFQKVVALAQEVAYVKEWMLQARISVIKLEKDILRIVKQLEKTEKKKNK